MRAGVIGFLGLVLVLGGWLSPLAADIADWIFADGFESGDVAAWSASNGSVLVLPQAASDGDFGLRIPLVSGEPAWVLDANPTSDSIIRTDFDLNIDGLVMRDGDAFDLYAGWVVSDTQPAFKVTLEQISGQTHIVLFAWDNSGGNVITASPAPIPGPGWHRVSVEFGVAGTLAATGELRIFVDGSPLAELTDFDNQGNTVDSLQLGAIAGVDQGTSGFLDIDVYTAVRLFDPWPCSTSGAGDPTDGNPLCLDVEGAAASMAVGGCGDGIAVWRGAEDVNSGRSRIGGIYGRPVRGSGRQPGETFLLVSDETSRTPSVAMDAQCNSTVAWASSFNGEAILATVVAVDGTPLTSIVQVSEGTDREELPAVATSADGRFLVVWRREQLRAQSIMGRFYAADATPLGSEFQLDSGSGQVSPPDVAMNDAGAAVAVWSSGGKIIAHSFDDTGSSLGLMPLTQADNDAEPAVAMAGDGSFTAVWTRSANDRRLFLRRFELDGGPLSDEIRVDVIDPADCAAPDVDTDRDDGIAVVWASTAGGRTTLLGRTFAPDGTPIEDPFPLADPGRVWLPTRAKAAAAERLLVAFTARTDVYDLTRGTLVATRSPAGIFADGFESGDLSAWSVSIP